MRSRLVAAGLLLALATIAAAQRGTTSSQQRPNIVLMFADNLGWAKSVRTDLCAVSRRRTSTASAQREFG